MKDAPLPASTGYSQRGALTRLQASGDEGGKLMSGMSRENRGAGKLPMIGACGAYDLA
jgi:hypothetical protein